MRWSLEEEVVAEIIQDPPDPTWHCWANQPPSDTKDSSITFSGREMIPRLLSSKVAVLAPLWPALCCCNIKGTSGTKLIIPTSPIAASVFLLVFSEASCAIFQNEVVAGLIVAEKSVELMKTPTILCDLFPMMALMLIG